jgi:hypothetical protein
MPGICLAYVICHVYARHISGIYLAYIKVCLSYAINMPIYMTGICPVYAMYMPGVCLAYAMSIQVRDLDGHDKP